MSEPKLSRKHKKLLQLIREGHDPEAACAGAGLDVSVARDPGLQAHIQDALRTGTALLRSKLTELALAGNGDVRALENLLARREGLIKQDFMQVKRSIVSATCPHCHLPLFEKSALTQEGQIETNKEAVHKAVPSVESNEDNGEAKPKPRQSYIVLGGI